MTTLLVIAFVILAIGAVAAFLAAWENTNRQVWVKLLAGLGGALAAVIGLLLVFALIWAVWSMLTGTVISPPEAEAPVVNVYVPTQEPPVVNVYVPTQPALVIAPTDVPPTPVPPTPAAPAGFFATPNEVWLAVYQPCPTDTLCIPLDVNEIHACVGEAYGSCWAMAREKDLFNVITPFMGHNPMDCGAPTMQDGWLLLSDRDALGRQSPPWPLTAVGSGVPDGYTGLLEGLTLRPCGTAPRP